MDTYINVPVPHYGETIVARAKVSKAFLIDGVCFVAHKETGFRKGWVVSEYCTGLAVGRSDWGKQTRKRAIENALKAIKRHCAHVPLYRFIEDAAMTGLGILNNGTIRTTTLAA